MLGELPMSWLQTLDAVSGDQARAQVYGWPGAVVWQQLKATPAPALHATHAVWFEPATHTASHQLTATELKMEHLYGIFMKQIKNETEEN